MPVLADQRLVKSHLRNLQSSNQLRRLLADLNYPVGDEPVSTSDWKPDLAVTARDGNLRVLARHDDFVVTYCRLPELRPVPEREMVTRLVRTERLNEEAIYAIYVGKDSSILDQEEPEDMDILVEAEAFIRRLQKDNPEYFAKVASMPDGVRSGRDSPDFKGAFVFCQAAGYQQLYLLDLEGSIQSTDIEKTLALLRCPPGEPRKGLPANHNWLVSQALRDFRTQVEERQAQAAQAPARRRGQAYVVNQLRALLRVSREATERETIITLEKALNVESLPPPVHTELNRLRKNKASGAALLGRLTELYRAFNLGAYLDQSPEERKEPADRPYPGVICSEAFT